MGIAYDHDEVPDPAHDGASFRITGSSELAEGRVGTYVPLEDDGEETVVPEALLQGLSGADVDLMMLDLQGTTIMMHPDEPSLDAPVNLAPSRPRATPPTLSRVPSPAPRRQSSAWNRSPPSLPPTSTPLPSEVSDDDMLDIEVLRATPTRTAPRPSPEHEPQASDEELSADLSVPSEPTVYGTVPPQSAPAALSMPAPSEPKAVEARPVVPEPARPSGSAWSTLTGLLKSVFPM
ncbi:MAG: hypothetical protein KC621_15630 [Myxococcales bacterium]|nr:hypothetical protein [Myxococcales bacterium]